MNTAKKLAPAKENRPKLRLVKNDETPIEEFGTAKNITEAKRNFKAWCEKKNIYPTPEEVKVAEDVIKDFVINRVTIILGKMKTGTTYEEIEKFLLEMTK